jgi:hypothetical protein
VPFEIDGDTLSASNAIDWERGTECADGTTYAYAAAQGPDDVYSFTAPKAGHYMFRVRRHKNPIDGAKGDPNLVVFDDCAASHESCFGTGYKYEFTGSHVPRYMEVGQTVFIAVGGLPASTYVFTIESQIFPTVRLNEWGAGGFIELLNWSEEKAEIKDMRLDLAGADSNTVYDSWMLKDLAPGLEPGEILVFGNTREVALFPNNMNAIYKLNNGLILKALFPQVEEPLVARLIWNDGDVLLDELYEPTQVDVSLSQCDNIWEADLFETPGKTNGCCTLE